jgi:hypothetical protein
LPIFVRINRKFKIINKMDNISYAKNLWETPTKKNANKGTVPEVVKIEKELDVAELLLGCDNLSKSIVEKYNDKSYKELNDALTNLSLVKKSLQSLLKN